MAPLLVSTGLVALAEIGDKTQLLAFVLATRFRRPVPIILGILIATLANHSLAGLVGFWLTSLVSPSAVRWMLTVSFFVMAVWALIPDKWDETGTETTRYGVFTMTVLTFFFAEMGDKTQLATVALTAQYQDLYAVVAGTTLGMLAANAPTVVFADSIAKRMPMSLVRATAATVFVGLGLLAFLETG